MTSISLRRAALLLANAVLLTAWLFASYAEPMRLSATPVRQAVIEQWMPSSSEDRGASPGAPRDPFSSASSPSIASAAAAPPQDAQPSLQLVGTVSGNDQLAVVVAGPGQPPQRVKAGTVVDGWTVTDIQKRGIVVARGRETWQVSFAPVAPRRCSIDECGGPISRPP